MALRWFRDEFAPGTDYASLTDAAAAVPPGCEGLLLLPHLNGMVNPDINPDARGVFFGISLSHRKPHFVRAVLEAVAYSLRDNVEALEEMGVECAQLVSLGGAARSALWLQIKSDVLGRKLSVMDNEETTSLGCAVLAAAGTGLYGSVEEAIKGMVVPGRTVAPNPGNYTVYDTSFKKYRELNRLLFLAGDETYK
jgi:xylulokinase